MKIYATEFVFGLMCGRSQTEVCKSRKLEDTATLRVLRLLLCRVAKDRERLSRPRGGRGSFFQNRRGKRMMASSMRLFVVGISSAACQLTLLTVVIPAVCLCGA